MKITPKQIAAWLGITILLLLYVFLLIFAIFDFPGREILFNGCLFATFIIPLIIWVFCFLYKGNKDRSADSADNSDISE